MNPGSALLDKFKEGLERDGHAASRTDQAMDWWSGPLRQRITVSKPFNSHDIMVSSVHIQTDLFKGPPPTEEIAKELVDLSHTGDVGAIFYDEKDGLYKVGTRMTLHEQNYDWMHVFISRLAFLQNSTALRMAFAFGAPEGLSVAESASPKGLNSDKYGGTVAEFAKAIRTSGASSASPWRGKELGFIKKILGDRASFEPGIDETKQLCATVKNDGKTFKVVADTETKHPFWGSGLTILIMLTDRKAAPVSAKQVLEMNRLHCTPVDARNATGFWIIEKNELAHFLFLPNTLHLPALAHILFMEKWGMQINGLANKNAS